MAAISSSYLSNAYYSMSSAYRPLSSGKRINSAADDAAGLAVAKSLQTQSTSYAQRAANARDEQNALNIRDGSLETVTSSLQRMRELSLQASNGTYGSAERAAIQGEIDQLKSSIGQDRLNQLGLSGYDVTSGNSKLSDIDSALNAVIGERGDIGAQYNAMDRQINALGVAEENTTASLSQTEDTDYARAITQMKAEQTMYQTRLMLQKKEMANQMSGAKMLYGMMGAK